LERSIRAVSASRRDDRGFPSFMGAGIRPMIQDGGRRGNGARRDAEIGRRLDMAETTSAE